jgi:septal ring factor EnvC (AmiA/AmiB activator)
MYRLLPSLRGYPSSNPVLLRKDCFVRNTLLAMTLMLTHNTQAANAPNNQARLKAIETEITTLQSSISTNASKQAELETTLKKIDLEISKTSQVLQALNTDTVKSQKALAILQTQQNEEQEVLTEHQQQLKSQVRAAYLAGHNPLLKVMLMQDNPYLFSRLLSYYTYFNSARKDEITQLQSSLQSIKAREILINQTLAQQKSIQAQHIARFESSRKEQTLREQVLKELNKDITQKGNRIAKLQSDAKSLNNIILKLQSKQESLQPPSAPTKEVATASNLPWPVQGTLTHKFGSQRSGNSVLWNGIFIKAAEGSPVKAVRSGKVVFADWLRGYGLLLIVDHGKNTHSLYAYNESILKNVGDWVLAHETIASVGKSGGMADPGLYFEIRQAGNPIDPLKWIQKQG